MIALRQQVARFVTSTVLVLAVASPVGAAPLVAYDSLNNLVFFDSAAPADVQRRIPVQGLAAADIRGMDRRPATGELYVVAGPCALVYSIDAPRGLPQLRGDPGCVIGVPPPPTSTGVDFNPVVDRIRLVAADTSNARLHPDTGLLVATDTALSAPGIAAAAYTNNVAGATATTLYAIDATLDRLVTIGGINGTPSPNGGVVTAVGPLGVDATDADFEILPDGTAFAALQVGAVTGLYTINLTTGAATLVGPIGDGTTTIVGFAGSPGFNAAIPASSPWSIALLGFALAGLAFVFVRRRARA